VSIATSIALEYASGMESEANPTPKPSVLGNYNEFWFNIRTLFRNMAGSLPTDEKFKASASDYAEALYHEIKSIISILRDAGSQIRPVFYISNYQDVDRKYRGAVVRADRTDKQKKYSAHLKSTVSLLLGSLKSDQEVDCKIFSLKIKSQSRCRALILTHHAYDLLGYKDFDKLDLIESHTGAIKSRDAWHTKYTNGKEIPMIPFSERLLPVFGDSETFHPMLGSARSDIIELAKAKKWSSITSDEKILIDVSSLKNKFLCDNIRAFK
jgi:hypothetical protein